MANKIGQAKLSYAQKLAKDTLVLETAGAEKIAKLGLIANDTQLKAEQEKLKKRIQNEKIFNKWSAKETKAQQAKALKALDERYKKEKKQADAIHAREKKAAAQALYKEEFDVRKAAISSALFGKGVKWSDRKAKLVDSFSGGTTKGLDALASAISDIAKKLEQSIDTIGARKSSIDTRMQGSKNTRDWSNSY